jgi:hypothetical protein
MMRDTQMRERGKHLQILRVLFPLGIGVTARLAVSEDPVAEVSEIDAFQLAISSQSNAAALAFIRDCGSSHLVPDLLELLRPDVALEVCANLSSASSLAPATCNELEKAVATAPAAGSPTAALLPSPPAEETPTMMASVVASPPPDLSNSPPPDQQQVVSIPPIVPDPNTGPVSPSVEAPVVTSIDSRGSSSHDHSANGGVANLDGTRSGDGDSSAGSSSGSSGGSTSAGSSGGSSGGSSSGGSGSSSGSSSGDSSSGSSGGGSSSSSGGSSSGRSGDNDGNPGHGNGGHGHGHGNSGDGN